jgi:hypothetical protein
MTNVQTRSRHVVETAINHGAYEAVAPSYGWPGWYAAYVRD